ncbi:nucleotidyltransferase domain-containing protein [Sulfurisphaera tokodaii]|nr:nucleotidyltransferase domain-containing protein [Sulfurisphaera tokodaii]HII73972.1 nucleotidyltransferase domain-containing protein [Sulfurisphaera tokodaii]
MQRIILENMELFRKATLLLRREGVLSIIFFGSRVIGKYKKDSDLDVLIIVRDEAKGLNFSESRIRFLKDTNIYLDTVIMTNTEFENNLALGTVLMGVSIAYCVTYDEINAYEKIENWSKEIRKYGAVLELPYGKFIVGRTIRKCKISFD